MDTVRLVLRDDQWMRMEPHCLGRPNGDWVKAVGFQRLFEAVSGDPDIESAMVDGTIVKVHRHGSGAKGGLRAGRSVAPKAA